MFSDLILSRKTRDFDVFGCPFTIFFARCYICPLIHNILCPLSSPVEIVDSISLPVEVNNSTIELYLPVDSQYSSPVEALNLIVEPICVSVNPVRVFDIYLEIGSDCATSVTQLLKVLHKIHNSLWQTSVTERTLKRFVRICASLTRQFWRPEV